MSTISITNYGETTEVTLMKSNYAENDNLAVVGTCDEGPWGNITVNTSAKLLPDHACVDINNIPDIVRILTEAGIAKPTGTSINPGGFVDYPVMVFDLDKLCS